MRRARSTAVVAVLVTLAGCGVVPGLGGAPDRTPGAGAASSHSGPGCLIDVAQRSAGTVTVIPDETDAGLIVETTIAHDRGERPDFTLTRTSPGVYTLFVTVVGEETPHSGETATPQRVRDGCRIGNRVESRGRMGQSLDRVRVVVGGETVLNRTAPESRTTWEIPRVIDIDSGEAVEVSTETDATDAPTDTSTEPNATATVG